MRTEILAIILICINVNVGLLVGWMAGGDQEIIYTITVSGAAQHCGVDMIIFITSLY